MKDVPHDTLRSLDRLLDVDLSIGQTRFHWLRSAREAPDASNIVGLTERIAFLRRLEIDPTLQARIAAGRWDRMIREGDATLPLGLNLSVSFGRTEVEAVFQCRKACRSGRCCI
ncbi:putative transposase [Agrobacterium rubi TR3 = NBRC 13261]|uniref:Putative transposase n=1 Tax=Agrobacterium rubi TR3 = NBRC 13261 TaxID=1368415 RepID=A0A081D2P9_9HYPH|nr:hypothetical protein [Agrobacterium rubi]GAK73195.1 putative transposase [Agrobacterium rubi TR3 = NBRC 13261]